MTIALENLYVPHSASRSAGVSPASSGGVSPPVNVCAKKRTGTVLELAAEDGRATCALLSSLHGCALFVSIGVYSWFLVLDFTHE
jgi:hypothetical protein